MGIDASLYGNIGRGVRSVADYDNEARAAKLNDLQLLAAQSQYDQGQRAIQDDNALRAMTLTGDDAADYTSMRRISPKAADTYRKAQLDAKKTQGDIDKAGAETASKKIETKIKAHDFHIQQLGSLTDPSQIDAWAAQGVRDGVLGMQASMEGARQMKEFAAQNGFEAAKQQALRGGMSAMQQLQAAHSDAVLKETGRHNVATEGQAATRDAETGRHNKTTEGLTARGQNMADARSRESTAAAMSKPFEVTGPDGLPVLVQQDKQGNITPVQGYGPKTGSSKPLTEGQAKALGFGTRMQESDKILNEIGDGFSPAGVNAKNAVARFPLIGGVAEMGANVMLSDNSQRAEQAQRDFLNAILRRESGAAVSDTEFSNARKQYFAQPGDSDAVKAQKASNRKLAMDGVLAEVPKGLRGSIDPKPQAAPAYTDPDKERRYQAWKAGQQ